MEAPSQRLPPEARTYWRLRGVGYAGIVLLAAVAFRDEAGWLGAVGVLAVAVVMGGLLPELRWRRWRYEVRDEEVDLVRGAFVVRRTIVPIRRVQHVDTESGPLRDALGLATVTFHTAAGGLAIPALAKGEAEHVRRRVAELTRTRDDT